MLFQMLQVTRDVRRVTGAAASHFTSVSPPQMARMLLELNVEAS